MTFEDEFRLVIFPHRGASLPAVHANAGDVRQAFVEWKLGRYRGMGFWTKPDRLGVGGHFWMGNMWESVGCPMPPPHGPAHWHVGCE